MPEEKPDLLDRMFGAALETAKLAELFVRPFALPKHSLFLAVEGIDGAGKTTLVPCLAAALSQLVKTENRKVVIFGDPGTTPLGAEIRYILKNSEARRCTRAEALLFLAARAQLVDELIVPALAERGTIVLLDRFTLSTLAYQGYGTCADGGDGAHWINELREVCTFPIGEGRSPHLTLILDLPVPLAMERCRAGRPTAIRTDRLEARQSEWEERRRGYQVEAQILGPCAKLIDASREPAFVLQDALDAIRHRFRCGFVGADLGASGGDYTVVSPSDPNSLPNG